MSMAARSRLDRNLLPLDRPPPVTRRDGGVEAVCRRHQRYGLTGDQQRDGARTSPLLSFSSLVSLSSCRHSGALRSPTACGCQRVARSTVSTVQMSTLEYPDPVVASFLSRVRSIPAESDEPTWAARRRAVMERRASIAQALFAIRHRTVGETAIRLYERTMQSRIPRQSLGWS